MGYVTGEQSPWLEGAGSTLTQTDPFNAAPQGNEDIDGEMLDMIGGSNHHKLLALLDGTSESPERLESAKQASSCRERLQHVK